MKKIKENYILIVIPVLVVIIGLFIIISLQGVFLFHPSHNKENYEALKKDNSYEEIRITMTNGKTISGWLKYNEKNKDGEIEKAPLLIYFIGNSDNAASIAKGAGDSGLFSFFKGYHILIMDYPGYGLSEGHIKNDSDFLNPGLEIYDWAIQQDYVDVNNIVSLGFSIGTGAATYLASEREVTGLILIAPYDNGTNLCNSHLNIVHGPIKMLSKFHLTSDEYAEKVKVPVLIFSSKADKVVPYDLSKSLSTHFDNIKDFVVIDDVSHGRYFIEGTVRFKIKEYLEERLILSDE